MRRALLVFCVVTFGACGDDDGASFEQRLVAAQVRVVEATCRCLWTDALREQCLDDAMKVAAIRCRPDDAARFSDRYPAYASCLAENAEREARCIEEAGCSLDVVECAQDALASCGPVPDDLEPTLSRCLPAFTCETGQSIALKRRCDGVSDCFDRSDEDGCDED